MHQSATAIEIVRTVFSFHYQQAWCPLGKQFSYVEIFIQHSQGNAFLNLCDANYPLQLHFSIMKPSSTPLSINDVSRSSFEISQPSIKYCFRRRTVAVTFFKPMPNLNDIDFHRESTHEIWFYFFFLALKWIKMSVTNVVAMGESNICSKMLTISKELFNFHIKTFCWMPRLELLHNLK